MRTANGILNDSALLKLREAHLRRLEAMFDGQHGEHVFVLRGVNGHGQSDLYSEPEQWVTEALADLADRHEALKDKIVFRPLSINPWPYGVHFVDTLFGARVYQLHEEKDNWQAEYLRSPVGRLAEPNLDTHPAFKLAQRVAMAFVSAGVAVPLFAPPVLSSPLNIAMNLYGQEFLEAMLCEPEAARRDLRVITNTIVRLHRWFQAHIPFEQLQMIETGGRVQPKGHGQLCGCSTHLLSPRQYSDYVAPLDQEILALYPGGGMIHLCGSHAQHIPTWNAMAELCAVQLNDRAAEDLALFFRGLRPDQVVYVNPCATMPVSNIMEITGGTRTVIVGDIREPIPMRLPNQGI